MYTISIPLSNQMDATNTTPAGYAYLKDTLKNPLLHMALVFIAGANFHKLKDFIARYSKKPTRGEQRAMDDAKALKQLKKKLRQKEGSKAKGKGNELSKGAEKPEKASDATANKTLPLETGVILSENTFKQALKIYLTSALAENHLSRIKDVQIPTAIPIISDLSTNVATGATGGKKNKRNKKGKKKASKKNEDMTQDAPNKDNALKLESYTRAYIDKEPILKDSVNPATYIKTPVDSQPRIPISARSPEVQATMVSKPRDSKKQKVALPQVLLGWKPRPGNLSPTTGQSSGMTSSKDSPATKQSTLKPLTPEPSEQNTVIKVEYSVLTPSAQKATLNTVAGKQHPTQLVAQKPTAVMDAKPIMASTNQSSSPTPSAKTVVASNCIPSSPVSSSHSAKDAIISAATVEAEANKEDESGEEFDSDGYEYESDSSEVEIIVDRNQPRKVLSSPAAKEVAIKEERSVNKMLADVFKAEADIDELNESKSEQTLPTEMKQGDGQYAYGEPHREQYDEDYDGDYDYDEGDGNEGDYDGDYDEDEYDEDNYEEEDPEEQDSLKPDAPKEQTSPLNSTVNTSIAKDQEVQCGFENAPRGGQIKQIIEGALREEESPMKTTTHKVTAARISTPMAESDVAVSVKPDDTEMVFTRVEVKVDGGALWYDPDLPANVGVNHVTSDEEYSGGVLRKRKATPFKTVTRKTVSPKTSAFKATTPNFKTPTKQSTPSHKKGKDSKSGPAIDNGGYGILGDEVEC